MSIATTPRPARTPATAPSRGGIVRSEFTKLRSVRSTYWSLLAVVAAGLAICALAAGSTASHWKELSPTDRATLDPTALSLAGLFLAQLAMGVLGVLMITSEYATGMIRTTLAAVPQRASVLAAKAIVFAAVAFLVGLVTTFASFFLGHAFLSSHVAYGLGDPGVLRAVIGGALYLTVLGLLGMGIGALLRHTAGAISTLFALVFVIPIVSNFLPRAWHRVLSKYSPADAGSTILNVRHMPDTLQPWAGFALFCAYALAVLVVAAIVLRRRDA